MVVALLKSFLQAIRYRKSTCRGEYADWLKWLKQSGTTLEEKHLELCKLDEENGWCAMHYAAKDYCVDLLGTVKKIEGGKQSIFLL